MTKISLNRLEASIAELEAGKGVVPRAELEALQAQADKLAGALSSIERWELPSTGEFYEDGQEVSYTVLWGSLGAQHHIRGTARAALEEYQAHKEGK